MVVINQMAFAKVIKIEYSAESQSNCHNVLVFAIVVLAFVLCICGLDESMKSLL